MSRQRTLSLLSAPLHLLDVPPTLLQFFNNADAQNFTQVCKLLHFTHRNWYIRKRLWKSNAEFNAECWKQVRKLRYVCTLNLTQTLETLVVDVDQDIDFRHLSATHFRLVQGNMRSVNQVIDTFPMQCTTIEISANVVIHAFPPGVLQITNMHPYAQICGLSTTLEKLDTGYMCNLRNLPHLTHITLREFDVALFHGMLGTCLQSLHLAKFNQKLDANVLPASLTSLKMDKYDTIISPGVLPANLRVLKLNYYQEPLVFPNCLEHLTVYDIRQPLPSSLVSLKVRGTIYGDLEFPNSLLSLTLSKVPDVFPNKLVTFHLRGYDRAWNMQKCPSSLRILQIWTYGKPYSDGTLGYWLRKDWKKWIFHLKIDWKLGLTE
jgi:hypothetical protein